MLWLRTDKAKAELSKGGSLFDPMRCWTNGHGDREEKPVSPRETLTGVQWRC
jgi:hypothetical protein